MLTFEKLENRYHLTGTLELKQAMHIGSGDSDDAIDSLFVKDQGFRHYIPGSSFRGALRSNVERIIGSVIPNSSCCLDPESSLPCPSGNRTKQKKMNEYIAEPGREEKDICQKIVAELCQTCKVFGSPFLSSRVSIADLHPVNNGKPEGQKRFGVAIDRDTETAAQGLLFTYQVVEVGEKFDFELWAENMTDENWGVLGIGLVELLSGHFWIGGKKNASGLGQCQLLENSLRLEYFEGSTSLKKYLTEQKWPKQKSDNQVKQFITDKVQALLSLTAA
ncbi:MAG: CRISPR-associated RAMP protein Csx7 [Desulfobacca sp.]|nr:CRISPR-associated RAMP protein Csx7 [Desulfobacca sp.]